MPIIINNSPYNILCRKPEEHAVVGIHSSNISSFASLDGVPSDTSGFIVAPFEANDDYPIYIYSDINITVFDSEFTARDVDTTPRHFESNKQKYADAFAYVKASLCSGMVKKVVLARSETTNAPCANPLQLFANACDLYPHCYIALIEIPDHGLWLTATPELLYKAQGHTGHTVALAGTMTWHEVQQGLAWSDKNIHEQKMVSDYISCELTQRGISFSHSDPYTSKAGHLAHIKTDFTLATNDISAMEIMKCLHPTPAVAGIPKQEAINIVRQAEGKDFRQYYSGFSGFINHATHHTECYVSLRLMHIDDNSTTLYAGGGILPQSSLAHEWDETTQKLKIMKRLFDLQK